MPGLLHRGGPWPALRSVVLDSAVLEWRATFCHSPK